MERSCCELSRNQRHNRLARQQRKEHSTKRRRTHVGRIMLDIPRGVATPNFFACVRSVLFSETRSGTRMRDFCRRCGDDSKKELRGVRSCRRDQASREIKSWRQSYQQLEIWSRSHGTHAMKSSHPVRPCRVTKVGAHFGQALHPSPTHTRAQAHLQNTHMVHNPSFAQSNWIHGPQPPRTPHPNPAT